MDRLFLDANVRFSAAYWPDTGLLELWKIKNVILCNPAYALEEARINLEEENPWVGFANWPKSFTCSRHLSKSCRRGFRCPGKMCQPCLPQSRLEPLTC